jgi:L-lactate dehydrogenase
MLLTLTDPAHSSVAPYGGLTPVLTSNPIAFGAPTGDIPILIDTTTSLQSNGMVALHRDRGEIFQNPDLMDNQGRPTCDPSDIATNPPGSILPIGGISGGHKGAAISIMVELLTGCLSGWGRAEPNQGWSAAAFLLILDPAVFGGHTAYLRQVDTLVQLCRNSVPRPGFDKVRLPGEGGLERRACLIDSGIPLPLSLIEELHAQARQYKISMPEPL